MNEKTLKKILLFVAPFILIGFYNISVLSESDMKLCNDFIHSSLKVQKQDMIFYYNTVYKKKFNGCPCPYSLDYNFEECGARSEWSKSAGNGHMIWCYESDIEKQDVSYFINSVICPFNPNSLVDQQWALCDMFKELDLVSQKKVLIYFYNTFYNKRFKGCTCPYSLDNNSQQCGNRSEWSKHTDKGIMTWCYENDINASDISYFISSVACENRK